MEIVVILLGFGQALVPPLLYNLGGWLQKSAADGRIEDYEIKKGLETFVGVFWKTAIAFFGLNAFANVDSVALAAGVVGCVWHWVDKFRKKNRD